MCIRDSDTTFRDSGTGPNDDDSWGGTIDEPNRQDEAQDRALAACDATGRNADPAKPTGPVKPGETKSTA